MSAQVIALLLYLAGSGFFVLGTLILLFKETWK